MIKYTVENITTLVDQKVFKDGSVNININTGSSLTDFDVKQVLVEGWIKSSDDLMALILATSAIRSHYPRAQLGLFLYYTMYGRQDRACNPGEAVGIKVFADIINTLEYTSVLIFDPHSHVTPACIKNSQVVGQFDIFGSVKQSWREWTIVASDAGATKKCEDFAKRVGAKDVLTFNKVRDMQSVEITHLEPNTPIQPNAGGKYFVLDDICDGGRTFVGVSNAIGAVDEFATIELAVTHGIFSYGVEVVTDVFSHVYTTNSFHPDMQSNEKVTVINI